MRTAATILSMLIIAASAIANTHEVTYDHDGGPAIETYLNGLSNPLLSAITDMNINDENRDIVERTLGYDDGRYNGTEYGTTKWFFVKYSRHLDIPYTVTGLWIFGGGLMTHIGIFSDDGFGSPDTLNPLSVADSIGISPPSWKRIAFNVPITDTTTSDIWVGINPGYTSYYGYVGKDNNSSGHSWLLEGASFTPQPFDYMVQLIVEGEKSGVDIAVLPSWTNPRYTDRNPSAHIAPANCAVFPRVPVQNMGSHSATFDVTCSIDSSGIDVYVSTQTVTALAPDDVTHVDFTPQWRVADTGNTYDVSVYTQHPGDCCLSNDTLRFTLTANSIEELRYDDYILNAYSVFVYGGEALAKRVTPSTYPAQILQLRYFIRSADYVDFYVWDDMNPSNRDVYEPGSPVWTTNEFVAGGSGHWHVIDVSDDNLMITASEVEWYVGLYAGEASVYFWMDYQEGFHYGARMPHFQGDQNYFFRAMVYYPEQTASFVDSEGEDSTIPTLSVHPTVARDCAYINCCLGRNMRDARLAICDVGGRVVKQLLLNGTNPLEPTNILWDATDAYGRAVPAGIYVISMRTEDYIASGKVILLR